MLGCQSAEMSVSHAWYRTAPREEGHVLSAESSMARGDRLAIT